MLHAPAVCISSKNGVTYGNRFYELDVLYLAYPALIDYHFVNARAVNGTVLSIGADENEKAYHAPQ